MAKMENIFEDYFDMVEPSSESPFIYHRWALLSGIGAMLGRQASLQFGFDTLYPNQYVCLMGTAGSRKSSSISVIRKLLEQSGYRKFSRERTSKEKFLADLGKGFDLISEQGGDDEVEQLLDISLADPSEALICAGELEDFLGSGDTGFISLLTNLWDNLDKYEHSKMTGKDIFVPKPTVSMIGGCTPTTFANVFPPEIMGQGMLSRMLLIYGGGARTRITKPPAPNPELWEAIVMQLKATRELVKGEFTVNETAEKIWDDIYKHDMGHQDRRLESYWSRRHNHYYKLCMIIAAADQRTEINEEDAVYANSVLHHAEQLMPKALGEFGRSDNSQQTDYAYSVIKKYPKTGIKLQDLFRITSTEFRDMKELGVVVQKLRSAGKITASSHGTLIPLKEQEDADLPHVDFSLLRETNYKSEKPS
jgi:hypothetical protein